jgi:SAM-dependent methyltransferase
MTEFLNKIYPFHRILIERYHIKPVLKEIIQLSQGSLIDIGCGEKPFHKYVHNKVERYVGLDHPETPHSKNKIDVFSTVYSIPFEQSSFDIALLTQVIEHLEDPKKALLEISRILKEEGLLILAWPFLYPIHEAPRDFYRYTVYGMEFLAKETNFEVQKIVAPSGFWVMFFGLLSVYLYGKSRIVYLCLSPLLFVFFLCCVLLNLIDKKRSSSFKWTWNYYAVLKKKSKDDKK